MMPARGQRLAIREVSSHGQTAGRGTHGESKQEQVEIVKMNMLRKLPMQIGVIGVWFLLVAIASSCALPERKSAVPDNLTALATIPGIPNARYWVDIEIESMVREARRGNIRRQQHRKKRGKHGRPPPASFLALSGGGDNGAFGAGLLVGWTKAGNRPHFTTVTGVNTGALIAPFAFLGPKYDAALREVFTQSSPKDIFKKRPMTAALFDDAMADSSPLLKTLGKYANQEMLREIAAEYKKGRFLLIATTNLDARQPVIWNIGSIAASGHPGALNIIKRIMVASAAVPGAFPPVMFDVEANGKKYQEMHVDGGATTQIFAYPANADVRKLVKEGVIERRKRTLYLIRNARLDAQWASVERRTLSIAGRAISSLIHSQGVGDLYRIYLTTRRDGIDFQLAYIPSSFKQVHKEEFDTAYMRKLFDLAYRMSSKGYPWQSIPPGYVRSVAR